MAVLKRLGGARWAQKAAGIAAAEYLRLVWKTSRFAVEPADLYERLPAQLPVIFAMWHGQHFMVSFAKPAHYPAKVLLSRHRDGEVNAIALEHLGIGTIRGSGDTGGRFDRKGGVPAFKAMVTALKNEFSIAITADVPKVARVAGAGVVKLAQVSGRPIIPVAVATSRRIELDNWDRTAVNLPFSRGAVVCGDPIYVPRQADEATVEGTRQAVEAALNMATARAYAIVDRKRSDIRG